MQGADSGADGDSGAVERLLADLADWAGDERLRAATISRSRQRWLRQQTEETATLVGTAVDLAEQQASVAVRTTGGRVHHGAIVAVGRDFIAVRPAPTLVTLLALDQIASLRTPVATREATGDRPPARPVTLGQTLAALAPTRPAVRIVAGGETLSGALRSVGEDVVTVRVDAQPPVHVYVALGSVEECTVFGSG